MKKYRVLVTPDAKADLKKYLGYLQGRKKNPQAVKNVLEDFRATKKSLSVVAGSLADPGSKKLKKRIEKTQLCERTSVFPAVQDRK